jgi:hypothetical protein
MLPKQVSGAIHRVNLEVEFSLEVYGMNLGIFHGCANKPFKIGVDLSMVKGGIELRLSGFDELWLDIDTKVFQVAEDGSGQFIEYRKAQIIQEMPAIRCSPWPSSGSGL